MLTAAILGVCFIVLHLVTVSVTCAVEGFNWGVNAWVLDSTGFLAAIFFTVQCWISSGSSPKQFRTGNRWIFIWAFITFVVRLFDTLMLFGIIKWSAIYITPDGAVFWSNIVSEVIFGIAFTFAALLASTVLLRSAKE